ncbi:hypothetical protein BASA62_008480 [Batrachochytrium salamandrivorans]|nr:hypothetical protein BASA62_008480 [Batrachochytrium salamandrivorans]
MFGIFVNDVYRELDFKIPNPRNQKYNKSTRGTIELDGKQATVGSKGTYVIRNGGLIKKTVAVHMNGEIYHLVSYYTQADLMLRRLETPREVPELKCLTPDLDHITLTQTYGAKRAKSLDGQEDDSTDTETKSVYAHSLVQLVAASSGMPDTMTPSKVRVRVRGRHQRLNSLDIGLLNEHRELVARRGYHHLNMDLNLIQKQCDISCNDLNMNSLGLGGNDPNTDNSDLSFQSQYYDTNQYLLNQHLGTTNKNCVVDGVAQAGDYSFQAVEWDSGQDYVARIDEAQSPASRLMHDLCTLLEDKDCSQQTSYGDDTSGKSSVSNEMMSTEQLVSSTTQPTAALLSMNVVALTEPAALVLDPTHLPLKDSLPFSSGSDLFVVPAEPECIFPSLPPLQQHYDPLQGSLAPQCWTSTPPLGTGVPLPNSEIQITDYIPIADLTRSMEIYQDTPDKDTETHGCIAVRDESYYGEYTPFVNQQQQQQQQHMLLTCAADHMDTGGESMTSELLGPYTHMESKDDASESGYNGISGEFGDTKWQDSHTLQFNDTSPIWAGDCAGQGQVNWHYVGGLKRLKRASGGMCMGLEIPRPY